MENNFYIFVLSEYTTYICNFKMFSFTIEIYFFASSEQ